MRSIYLLTVLGLAGCSEDPTSPTPPPPPVPSIAGTWNMPFSVSGQLGSCSSTVPRALTLSQVGSSLNGNFQPSEIICEANGVVFAWPGSASVTGLLSTTDTPGVYGFFLVEAGGFCQYSGTLKDGVVSQGQIVCQYLWCVPTRVEDCGGFGWPSLIGTWAPEKTAAPIN